MQECFLHSLVPLLFWYLWCIYMQEFSVHSLLFPWVQCQSLPCTLSHMSSIQMDAINFYVQEGFFTLTDTTSIPMLIHLRFPWVQCQSSNPVLSQCSQSSFVTVDAFIALYTRSYVFCFHGCNKFLHARTFFTLADTIAPIFTSITEVWHLANRAVFTNNSTVITKVCANWNRANQWFPLVNIVMFWFVPLHPPEKWHFFCKKSIFSFSFWPRWLKQTSFYMELNALHTSTYIFFCFPSVSIKKNAKHKKICTKM